MPSTDQTPPFEAYAGAEPFIFVSYAHKDAPLVFPELQALREAGYRIWYDEGIDPANEWTDEIAMAIRRCSFFLVYLSPNSVASRNVRNEIQYGLSEGKAECSAFLGVFLCETELPAGVSLSISAIQHLYRYRLPEERYWRKLLQSLPPALSVSGGETGRPETPKPPLIQRSVPLPMIKVKGWRLWRTSILIVVAVAVVWGVIEILRGRGVPQPEKTKAASNDYLDATLVMIPFKERSDELEDSARLSLMRIGIWSQRHPDLMLILKGYANTEGSSTANIELSHQRAAAVGSWLTQSLKVSEKRFRIVGLGVRDSNARIGDPESNCLVVEIAPMPFGVAEEE